MQHLVKLVRAAAAEVPLSPVPPIDIGTLRWEGEFTDLVGLALISAHNYNMDRYWDSVLGNLDNFRPVSFLTGERWKCERLTEADVVIGIDLTGVGELLPSTYGPGGAAANPHAVEREREVNRTSQRMIRQQQAGTHTTPPEEAVDE